MKNNRVGTYRQRVTLMAPPTTETLDSVGQPILAPVAVGTYWAEVRPAGGRELVSADSVKQSASHVVTMRYLGDSLQITSNHQLILKGRTLNIVNVNNTEERNRQLVLTCQEVT